MTHSQTGVEEVFPGIFKNLIPLPGSPLKAINSYFIRGKERNLIVDTGMKRPECAEAMNEGLKLLNADLSKTDFFITHHHADHYGLVGSLLTNTSRLFFNGPDSKIVNNVNHFEGAQEYAALNGFPQEDGRMALANHPGNKFSTNRFLANIDTPDGGVLEIGDYSFRYVHTPGHTRGHTCLYDEAKKLLIAGDHILSDITPNIGLLSFEGNSLNDFLHSLDKVAELDVDFVLPGHRNVITNCRERIRELKQHHKERLSEVLEVVETRGQSVYEVASHLTWDMSYGWDRFPVQQKWFAFSEASSHLKYLEDLGKLERRKNGHGFIYTMKN